MAAMDGRIGLPLAQVERAVHLERRGPADAAKAAPERRRDAAIIRVLHHAAAPAVLDALAPFAAELELVARVVDRPGQVGAHQHPSADRGDHFVQRAGTRLHVAIRHLGGGWAATRPPGGGGVSFGPAVGTGVVVVIPPGGGWGAVPPPPPPRGATQTGEP